MLRIRVQGLGFRAQSLGIRVFGWSCGFTSHAARSTPDSGLWFRFQVSSCRVQGSSCKVLPLGFRVHGSCFMVQDSWFRVQGSWLRVQD